MKYSKLFFLLFLFAGTISATQAQTTNFQLSWDANREPNISHYMVFRDTLPNPEQLIATVNYPATDYIDSTVVPGITYYYRLKAVNTRDSISAFSETIHAGIPRILLPDSFHTPIISSGSFINIDAGRYTYDPDNSNDELEWDISGAVNVFTRFIDRETIQILAPTYWQGRETLILNVRDPDSFSDADSITIIVNGAGELVNENTIVAFPVPFRPSQHIRSSGINFSNLPPQSTLRIFNELGEPVFARENLANTFTWNTGSYTGRLVSSGIYIYQVNNSNGQRLASGKLVIIR